MELLKESFNKIKKILKKKKKKKMARRNQKKTKDVLLGEPFLSSYLLNTFLYLLDFSHLSILLIEFYVFFLERA